MQNARNDPSVPGALGLGQSRATSIYNGYLFFTFLMPMPFALVSDFWLGRYKTLLLGLRCGDFLLLFYFASLQTRYVTTAHTLAHVEACTCAGA